MNEIRCGWWCWWGVCTQQVPFFPPLRAEGWGWNLYTTVAVDASSLKSIFVSLLSFLKHASFLFLITLGFEFYSRRLLLQTFPFSRRCCGKFYAYQHGNFFFPSRNILSILHKKYSFDCWFRAFAVLPFEGGAWNKCSIIFGIFCFRKQHRETLKTKYFADFNWKHFTQAARSKINVAQKSTKFYKFLT